MGTPHNITMGINTKIVAPLTTWEAHHCPKGSRGEIEALIAIDILKQNIYKLYPYSSGYSMVTCAHLAIGPWGQVAWLFLLGNTCMLQQGLSRDV